MATPAYEQILQVQELDMNLMQARHRQATHPLRAELQSASESVAAAEATVAEIEERRHGLDRELSRLSDEVELLDAKRNDVEAKLYDGSVTASKELLALQEESSNLLDRKRSIEDDELEIMEQIEGVDEELAEARRSLTGAEGDRDRADDGLRSATAEIDGEIGDLERQRTEAAAGAAPELLATYERLAPQFEGVALARFADGRCDGCHMQLSAVAVDQINRAAADAVVTCEECGRLLVR